MPERGSERDYDRDSDRATGSGKRRAGAHSWRHRLEEQRKAMPLWQELPLLLIVAFCLAVLVRTFLLQAFYIPSGSMENTLEVGDRVLVNKIVYDIRPPQRGEIVVFKGTDKWASEHQPNKSTSFIGKLGHTVGDLVGIGQPGETDFIKRVIGTAGDKVFCCDKGRVTVNGYPLDETYVFEDSPIGNDPNPPANPKDCRIRQFGPITVEPGQMFVMGDHRRVSRDSRCQGQVPILNIIGRSFVKVWPTSHAGGLRVPPTFEGVPKATPVAAPALEPPSQPRPRDALMTGAALLALGLPMAPSLAVPARSGRRRPPRPRTLRS